GYEVNRDRAPELLAMIDAARAEGVDVTMDTYPYLAGATYLHAFLPGWMHAGGSSETLARLRQNELRERLREEMEETGSDGFHDLPMDWSIIVISGVRPPAPSPRGRPGPPPAAASAPRRPADL